MNDRPSPQRLREIGYAANAEVQRLSDNAWLAFKAWTNHPAVPDDMRWKPTETAKGWERVANALRPGEQQNASTS